MFKSRYRFAIISCCISFLLLAGTMVFCMEYQNFNSGVNINYTAPKESDFLLYTDNDDGSLTVSGYDKALAKGETSVYIPSEHDGKPVKTIGYRAFCSSEFTHVSISKGIEVIEEGAFEDTNLVGNLILPEGLKIIENRAFEGKFSASTNGLTKIVIPSTVTDLGDNSFAYQFYLAEIEYNAINAKYSTLTRVNGSLIFEEAGCFSAGLKLTFGEDVEAIPDRLIGGFDLGCSLNEIIFGSRISSIGGMAFYYLSTLEKAIIKSPWVYNNATGEYSCGRFLDYTKAGCQIYVLKSIIEDEANSNTYLNDTKNFTRDDASNVDYVIFTKV